MATHAATPCQVGIRIGAVYISVKNHVGVVLTVVHSVTVTAQTGYLCITYPPSSKKQGYRNCQTPR